MGFLQDAEDSPASLTDSQVSLVPLQLPEAALAAENWHNAAENLGRIECNARSKQRQRAKQRYRVGKIPSSYVKCVKAAPARRAFLDQFLNPRLFSKAITELRENLLAGVIGSWSKSKQTKRLASHRPTALAKSGGSLRRPWPGASGDGAQKLSSQTKPWL